MALLVAVGALGFVAAVAVITRIDRALADRARDRTATLEVALVPRRAIGDGPYRASARSSSTPATRTSPRLRMLRANVAGLHAPPRPVAVPDLPRPRIVPIVSRRDRRREVRR